MALLLVAAGGVFALFYIINAIIQLVRQKTRIGFVQTWLAFLVVLLPVLGLVNNTLSEEPYPAGSHTGIRDCCWFDRFEPDPAADRTAPPGTAETIAWGTGYGCRGFGCHFDL